MTNRRDLSISMPRRYYRPRRTVVVRPKKKWASNMSQFVGAQTSTVNVAPSGTSPSTHFYITNDLVVNKAQAGSPTPVILKCGNFKLKGDMKITLGTNTASGTAQFAGCIAYIIYVPEGVEASYTLTQTHPEWIMAWSPINIDVSYVQAGSSNIQNVEKFSMSSRLKRNLNSGDKVVLLLDLLFVPGAGTSPVAVSMTYQPSLGVQFWTCSN